MASIYGWVPLLAALVLSLVFENGVHGQNTTQCRDFALNIVCTSEHRSPPDCTPARNPLVACAEEKDNLCRYICPSLVPLAAAFLKSTYDTVKTTCSDHEISSGFTKSPECWPHAAMCAISLNALPEGGNIDCRRFMPKLVQCQKNATESCASLQTKLLKTTLAQNPCYSESAFQASSAHFPVGLPSVSLFAILIILLVL